MNKTQLYAMASNIRYSHKIKNKLDSEYHSHKDFKIHFILSGDIHFFIEKKVYRLQHGDLIVINNNEFHKYTVHSGTQYEQVSIGFDPALARFFSTPDCDLLKCFTGRPKGEKNRVHLSPKQIGEIQDILNRFESIPAKAEAEAPVLKLSCLLELLVFVNRAFSTAESVEEQATLPEKLQPILSYIENNLDGDLSLEALGRRFFISSSYLSFLFKEETGVNINEYIIFKRIARAKELLSQNYSVTEACHMSGFNDYSNFIRRFKKIVGVSPGQYKKMDM